MRADLVKQFPDYVRLTNPPPATIADAQTALRPGEALIAIYVGPSSVYLWAVKKDTAPVFAVSPLARADIDQAVKLLRGAVDPEAATASDIPAFDTASAYKLYAGLLAPVKPGWQGADDLLVVRTDRWGRYPSACWRRKT